jgi:hypothetical protein
MAEPEALAAAFGYRHTTLGVLLAEVEAAVREGHDVRAALRLAVLLGAVMSSSATSSSGCSTRTQWRPDGRPGAH